MTWFVSRTTTTGDGNGTEDCRIRAGATGRGHVGLLAWQAGFEIVFVDKDANLVEALRRAGRYTVQLFGGPRPQSIEVTGWRVYHHQERDAIAAEIVDAELVLTAVFDPNLPDVAQTVARAVRKLRAAKRSRPLNLVACENMMDSSSTLGKHVMSSLTGAELDYAGEFLGFPDCMISRVVPRPEPDPLLILTEDYNEWTTRAEAFKGDKPAALIALELVNNQTARLERKLLIHNGGHAICGYFGYHRGHRFIHEAVADPFVVERVVNALDEIGEVVRRGMTSHPRISTTTRPILAAAGRSPNWRTGSCRRARSDSQALAARRFIVLAIMAGKNTACRERGSSKASWRAL